MRVLVLGAGGPAGVNTCRALAAHDVIAWDENPDHLVWCHPLADTLSSIPLTVDNVNALEADVVIPQPDRMVAWLADRPEIEARTFLPDRRVVALCQDKFESGLAFRRAELRDDRVELIQSAADLPFNGYPLWLRARWGAGAKAAVRASSPAEARHWFMFWHQRDPMTEFVLEDHLPGRDLAWSGIYYQGDLVCSFLRQRLEYIYPGLTPEGLTGTPTIAEIIQDDMANEMAEAAVAAVDDKPHGIYSVDMREDAVGFPSPTEINAGRGFTTFGLWATQAEHNLMEIVANCAVGGFDGYWPGGALRDILPEGLRLSRHIDCPAIFTREQVPA